MLKYQPNMRYADSGPNTMLNLLSDITLVKLYRVRDTLGVSRTTC